MLNRLFRTFSARSRTKKLELFHELVPMTGDLRILDIGGQVSHEAEQVLEIHPNRQNLTVLNIMKEHLDEIGETYPEVKTTVGDACCLPFGDKSFDLVYSNAVIEHVGDLEKQAEMAREVMRVGRGWFITTPNRWYPFEFHTRLPLVSWLPPTLMKKAASLWSYNHVQRRYQSGITTDTRLMTSSELRRIFSGSRVLRCRVTFWPETLIVTSTRVGSSGSRPA